jgi:hypothetical protein
MKETIDKIQPLVEFVNTFETPQKLKRIMDHFFKDDLFRSFDKEDPTLLNKDVAEMIDDTAAERGLTQKEALEQLMKEELKGIAESEKRFKELAKRSGMPMSRKEYEKRRAERDKASHLLGQTAVRQTTSCEEEHLLVSAGNCKGAEK